MSDGTRFSYAGATLVAETVGTGPLVYLLIHGIGMGRTIFGDLTTHLTAGDVDGSDSTVIAVDLPGYGEAPEPVRTLTIERTADLIAAYLRHLHAAPAVIVGHSMGTQVAVEVAARHPLLVRGIVLVAPTVDPRERTAVQQVLRLAQDLLVESPRVIAVGAREYVRAGPNFRGKFRAMLVHRPEDTYPRVAARALVLRGEKDYVARSDWCRSVTARLPEARLVEVPGHGHETMIRDSAPAARAILEFVAAG
ncbi:alpha/beta fold hydrolase [Microbacterium pygmaeum]|uniref:Pimeloyl-ACP methyl ester carboxylesterase n=1 Tax=Microbacterium pygmaeum TaxID=370764 RepID=A0A1G7WUC5_9MICO|nr:alpha/beta hydrolase [Microbacterium pygmaeum]SDG75486.1 Pimeloyl-ACP methyl ester carboxylesterase [Microbacterium pygmaeum]